ncbi:hypothetical protein C8F04DRAFT_1258501 [Mycena alexandri]|uniref:Uncharacterized protein n=1 Tax=Mycena alexandri TaxID=1745969 RepID=A0AAD6X406_9AGAR|nr:hypothetical protein C8F04DRAFT_1258501 [Mycena alexandri]
MHSRGQAFWVRAGVGAAGPRRRPTAPRNSPLEYEHAALLPPDQHESGPPLPCLTNSTSASSLVSTSPSAQLRAQTWTQLAHLVFSQQRMTFHEHEPKYLVPTAPDATTSSASRLGTRSALSSLAASRHTSTHTTTAVPPPDSSREAERRAAAFLSPHVFTSTSNITVPSTKRAPSSSPSPAAAQPVLLGPLDECEEQMHKQEDEHLHVVSSRQHEPDDGREAHTYASAGDSSRAKSPVLLVPPSLPEHARHIARAHVASTAHRPTSYLDGADISTSTLSVTYRPTNGLDCGAPTLSVTAMMHTVSAAYSTPTSPPHSAARRAPPIARHASASVARVEIRTLPPALPSQSLPPSSTPIPNEEEMHLTLPQRTLHPSPPRRLRPEVGDAVVELFRDGL